MTTIWVFNLPPVPILHPRQLAQKADRVNEVDDGELSPARTGDNNSDYSEDTAGNDTLLYDTLPVTDLGLFEMPSMLDESGISQVSLLHKYHQPLKYVSAFIIVQKGSATGRDLLVDKDGYQYT